MACSSSVKVNDGLALFVGVAETGEGRYFAKVEGNPSRLADPDGCTLLPLDQVQDAAAEFVAIASALAPPLHPDVGECKVTRLDVARDFRGLADPGLYVRGLQGVKRPYAKVVGAWSDPARGAAETLMVGSKSSGYLRAYDQHAAYADKGAPKGSLRVELEAKRPWLQRIEGMATVYDLTVARMARLYGNRWEWGAMGTEVAAGQAVVAKVNVLVDQGALTAREATVFLGYLLQQAYGTSTGITGSATLAKYRALQRRLGVAISADSLGGSFVGRLDLETGTEVFRAA